MSFSTPKRNPGSKWRCGKTAGSGETWESTNPGSPRKSRAAVTRTGGREFMKRNGRRRRESRHQKLKVLQSARQPPCLRKARKATIFGGVLRSSRVTRVSRRGQGRLHTPQQAPRRGGRCWPVGKRIFGPVSRSAQSASATTLGTFSTSASRAKNSHRPTVIHQSS